MTLPLTKGRTSPSAVVDAPGRHADQLARTLASARCVCFDFDGPLCDLFARRPAGGIARLMLDCLERRGRDLPREVVDSRDPHHVLRHVGEFGGPLDELRRILAEEEVSAADSAEPTDGAGLLVRALAHGGYRLAVTSNNSEEAITAYLVRTGLDGYFEGAVFGRAEDPGLMKPHPHCVSRALLALDTAPEACLMLGDSPADVRAARVARVPFLGFAPDNDRRRLLEKAGAPLIVDSLRPVLGAVLPRA